MSTPPPYRQEHDMSTTAPTPDESVKVPHLVLGLLLLGAAATWALLATGVVDADTLPYLGPGLLVAAGVVGLAASVAGTRRARRAARPRRLEPAPGDHPSVTMEDPPAPGSTRRLEQQDPHHDTDPTDGGEPTAPLHRPEDHR